MTDPETACLGLTGALAWSTCSSGPPRTSFAPWCRQRALGKRAAAAGGWGPEERLHFLPALCPDLGARLPSREEQFTGT